MSDVLGALASLFVLVAFGAVVPVVPTGAAVSAAAALAFHQHSLTIGAVVLAGAVGAYLGDAITYLGCRFGGEQLARRLRWLRNGQRLDGLAERLREREVTVLLVSRLLPGGRIPVLLTIALAGLDWRRFAWANAPACVLWSVVYAGIGVVGGSVFPEPWQSVLVAVALVLAVTQLVGLLRRRSRV
ncbi:DedA family protein [Plantactinospora mayteni]|uniref:Membrane protein n=1 Tax=Plantactinospora mayteni TaxID=566021 RepID=A0ABQ4F1Y6_9ACTN|nr:VTT domain-containing protein [Plantactinospora mayteni]GIH00929.1 membrane protein [Plantactinospora mayteni]